jgi:hypothetical protein
MLLPLTAGGTMTDIVFADHDVDRDAVLEAADDDEVGFADNEEDEDFDGDDDEEDDDEDDEDETEELTEPSDE